jgi:hypothetical protein
VNSGDGLLTLNNVPANYTVGSPYNLEVMLADAGMLRWGFQVTVLDGANQMAGTFTVTDPTNTWLSDNTGSLPDYLNHTLAGTYGGTPDGPVYWDFDWIAPSTPVGMVTFYLAGCAADSNGNRAEDYVYTYTISSTQASRDVAVLSLDDPPDSLCVDTTYAVQATVTNDGDLPETVDLVATIDPSGYADTVQVSLGVGQTGQVTFQVWQCPGTPDTYTYTVNAILPGDVNPGNNSLNKQMDSYECAIHDAAVVAILSPPDSICVGSTYLPRARVTNLGNVHEYLSALCTINPGGYVDTSLAVYIAPAETAAASFSGWTVPAGLDTYSVVVRTLLPGDINGGNDSLDKQSVSHDCTVHDVGIVSLVDPPLDVCLDSTYTPAIEVMNYGNGPEMFRIDIQISPGYSDTFLVSTLLPGQSTVASFSAWNTGSAPQTFQLSAGFSILGDTDPSNDSLFETINSDTCYWTDLGVVSILSPNWWVCTDSSYTPTVRVVNNGEGTETFLVGMTIGPPDWPIYEDSAAVVDLIPGDMRDVDLKVWTAPWLPDTLAIRAALILGFLDQDPGNDFKLGDTYVYNCPGIAESIERRPGPASTGLLSVYPSPSRGPVRFHYSVEHACPVRLDILDTSGREIRSVYQGRAPAGFAEAVWDLTSDSGERVGGGVYFARFSARETVSLRKFIVVR